MKMKAGIDSNLRATLESAATEIRARIAAGGPPQLGAALAFVLAALRKLNEAEEAAKR